jgi:hypothetical protein
MPLHAAVHDFHDLSPFDSSIAQLGGIPEANSSLFGSCKSVDGARYLGICVGLPGFEPGTS